LSFFQRLSNYFGFQTFDFEQEEEKKNQDIHIMNDFLQFARRNEK
jgi:hypothetical protein